MKAITRNQWDALARHESPAVSLYLPLHPQDWADQGDVLRLNQLASQAESQLLAIGISNPEIQILLNVVRDIPKSPEWKSRRGSVVALVNRDSSHILWLDGKVDAAAWGDNCFHVRPLLPFVVESDQYLLLKLSENHCSLNIGSAAGISGLAIDELPSCITDARDVDRGDPELQVHAMNAGGLGRRGSIFHGHGGQADSQAVNWQAYLQQIASAIQRRFPNAAMPLVLATVEDNFAEWRQITGYPDAQQVLLGGNPDHVSDQELHDRAWQAMAAIRQREAMAIHKQYEDSRNSGRVRAGLGEVISAASNGRVDVLFVDSRAPVMGRYDAQSESIQLAERADSGDQCDLIELAIRETVKHRGRVFPLEQISQTPSLAEALLRY